MQSKINQHLHSLRRLMKTIEKFNKGLEKIRDNGELAKIGKKWFGQDVSKPE